MADINVANATAVIDVAIQDGEIVVQLGEDTAAARAERLLAEDARTGSEAARDGAELAEVGAVAARDVAIAVAGDPTDLEFPRFSSIAALLADTLITDSVPGRTWLAEGYSYEEAASAATDHDVTTAGGIKLYGVPDAGGFDTEQFGGGVGKTGAQNSVASNLMRQASERLGGITMRYTRAGSYEHGNSGANSYAGSGDRDLCVDLGAGNVSIFIAAGSEVKIADNQMIERGTGSDGSLDLFAGDTDLITSFHLVCDGTISNNRLNQPGWTRGPGQSGSGGSPIRIKGSQHQGDYVIEGNGYIGHAFSNSFDIGSDTTLGGSFHFGGTVTYINSGEGPQPAGFLRVTGHPRFMLNERGFAMAGDAIEPARCDSVILDWFTVEWAEGDSISITAITQADPAVATSVGHGLNDSDVMLFRGTGLTDIDNFAFNITVLDADTFSLQKIDNDADFDGTGLPAYGGGGIAVIMQGKPSGSAVDAYGVNNLHIKGGTVDNWWSLFGFGGPSGGLNGGVVPTPVCGNVKVRGLQSTTGFGDGYQGFFNENQMEMHDITVKNSPNCLFWQITGPSTAAPIILTNVRIENGKKQLASNGRKLVWHGGGNVNSIDFGFDYGATVNNTEHNVDWQDLDFSGAVNGNRINAQGGVTGVVFQGRMANINLGENDGDIPGGDADIDFTSLEVSGITPSSRSGTAEPIGAFTRRYVRLTSGSGVMDEVQNPCKNCEVEIVNNRGANVTLQHDSASSFTPLFNKSGVNDTLADQDSRTYKYRDATQAATAGMYEV